METKFKNVKIGQDFVWCGHEFTKLDKKLCIINPKKENKDIYYCCFDNVNNDYSRSLIRHFICLKYIDLLDLNFADMDYINGGMCTLLSLEEYKKYRNLIKPCGYWWWLRSPDASGSDFAYIVGTGGDIGYGRVDRTYAVRAAFNLKSNTIVLI